MAGALALLRGNAILVLAVLVLGMAWEARRNRIWIQRMAMVVAGALIFLGPVLISNWMTSGTPYITHNGGLNFYAGNSRYATGAYPKLPFVKSTPVFEEQGFHEEAERRAGRALSPAQASRVWYRETLRDFWEDPVQLPRIMLRKLQLMIDNYEIPDHYDFDCVRREFVPSLWLGVLSWAPLFALAIAGLLSASWTRELKWVLLIGASYAVSVVLFFVLSRIRLPVVPFAAILAGRGLVELWSALRKRHWPWLAILGAGTASAAALATLPAPLKDRVRTDYAHCCHLSGTHLVDHGNLARGIPLLETAARLAPERDDNLYNLAQAYHRGGQFELAEAGYRQAIAINPRLGKAEYNLGLILLGRGELKEALSAFQAAGETGLQTANLWGALGSAKEKLGDETGALAAYERALALEPNHRLVLHSWCEALGRRGSRSERCPEH
jgi:Tfp pilus assembly protein PilF